MSNLILVASPKPPVAYLKALKLVGLDYFADLYPSDLSPFSGLLLIGGGDIFPQFYCGGNYFENGNFVRDAREFQLIDYFYSKKLPILGICRGLQIVNAFFGGTLKNVDCHNDCGKDILHPILSPTNGFLQGLQLVNSNHRQAVDKLCPCADCVCRAEDGIVEGFTIENQIFAVQFHPERMDKLAIFKVYGRFCDKVKNRKTDWF